MNVAFLIKTLAVISFSLAGIGCLYYFLKELGLWNPRFAKKQATPLTLANEVRGLNRCRSYRTWLEGLVSPQVKEFASVLGVLVLSRLLIVVIGDMAVMLLQNGPGNLAEALNWMWSKWDAPHFLDVARHGYQNSGEERFFIVFLPLYPWCVRLFALILGSYEWSGVLVSHLALATAGYYLYQLAKMDFGRRIARTAVVYLAFFPVSFFLGIVYSDSLFLALSLATMYYARRQDWVIASIFGCMASLSRNFGVLLLIPALMEFLLVNRVVEKIKIRDWSAVLMHFRESLTLGFIPAGFGIYLLINRLVTGDWFKFATYQREHWSNQLGFFAENLAVFFGYALNGKPSDKIALWIPEIVAIILVMGLIFYGMRKIRISYLAYMFVYLLTCVSATWLISGPRYLMGLFPIYILLALPSRHPLWHIGWLAFSIALLAFFTTAFVNDFYVM